MPPPRPAAVQPLGVASGRRHGGIRLPGSGSLFTLVPAGHLHLDGSGGIPPAPGLQGLRQKIPAQTQLGGMGWVIFVLLQSMFGLRSVIRKHSVKPVEQVKG